MRRLLRPASSFAAISLVALLALTTGCGGSDGSTIFVDEDPTPPVANPLDESLRALLVGMPAIDTGGPFDPALVELGQALMFDKELSGNRDTACATCHHPVANTGDALSLSIGTGGTGLGATRVMGAGRMRVPRNAPDVFNRGAPQWASMFWDSRVRGTAATGLITPAGTDLPAGVNSALSAQAMFPPTSRAEMRGDMGDLDVFGNPNELAIVGDMDFVGIWAAIEARFKAIPGYVDMFAAAYPGVALDDIGMEHIGNAIGAFQSDAWAFADTPFDRYLAGDSLAMTDSQKRGAVLFFGSANCVQCHQLPLFTDQMHHNVALPQVGGGRGVDAPLDLGLFRVSGFELDVYKFRTPPLRNTALTGPWMHNGCFTTLEQVVRHYNDAETSLRGYDPTILAPEFWNTHVTDPAVVDDILDKVDGRLARPLGLTDQEVADLVAFLNALTDPATANIAETIPDSVPSGLPVDR